MLADIKNNSSASCLPCALVSFADFASSPSPEGVSIPSLRTRIYRSIALQQRAFESAKVSQGCTLLGMYALNGIIPRAIVLDTSKDAHGNFVRIDIALLAPSRQWRRVAPVCEVLLDRTAMHGEAMLRGGARATDVDCLADFVIKEDIHKPYFDITEPIPACCATLTVADATLVAAAYIPVAPALLRRLRKTSISGGLPTCSASTAPQPTHERVSVDS